MFNMGRETAEAVEVLNTEDFSIHPALTEAVMSTTSNDNSLDMGSDDEEQSDSSNKKMSVGEVHVSVAANETVGTSEGQTIMIIQEEPVESSEQTDGKGIRITSTETINYTALLEDKLQLETELRQLKQQHQQLQFDKNQSEQTLQAEIDQLKLQVQVHNTEISSYQKREQELMSQLSVPLDSRIQQLLVQLGSDHQQLLHQQMALLKQTYQEIRQESASTELLNNGDGSSSQNEFYDGATTTLAFQCKQTGELVNSEGQTILLNTNGNENVGTSVTYVIETNKYDNIDCNSVLAQDNATTTVVTSSSADSIIKTKLLSGETPPAKRKKVS